MIAYTYAVVYTLFPVLRHREKSVVPKPVCYVYASTTYIYYFVVINLFVPLLIIVVLNCVIFNIANRHTKQILSFNTPVVRRSIRTSVDMDSLVRPSSLISNQSNQSHEEQLLQNKRASTVSYSESVFSFEQRKKARGNHSNSKGSKGSLTSRLSRASFICNIKAAKRIALLVGECVFCWLFYIVVVLVNLSGNYSITMTKVGNIINYSSLFLNALVYGLFNPKIREVVFRTSCCVSCRNKESSGESLRPGRVPKMESVRKILFSIDG